MLVGMLTEDELQDIEGDVGALLRFAGVDDDVPPPLDHVCAVLTGSGPRLAAMRAEGRARRRERVWRVELRMDVLGTPRGRQVLGHELGHVYAAKMLRREVTEEWCDAFGAMLSAPRRAVRGAIAEVGHRVGDLAELLEVERAAALLRIGEVSGRPVALIRRPGLVVPRGEPFPWPPSIEEALAARAVGLHPVRVGARWGMMSAA